MTRISGLLRAAALTTLIVVTAFPANAQPGGSPAPGVGTDDISTMDRKMLEASARLWRQGNLEAAKRSEFQKKEIEELKRQLQELKSQLAELKATQEPARPQEPSTKTPAPSPQNKPVRFTLKTDYDEFKDKTTLSTGAIEVQPGLKAGGNASQAKDSVPGFGTDIAITAELPGKPDARPRPPERFFVHVGMWQESNDKALEWAKVVMGLARTLEVAADDQRIAWKASRDGKGLSGHKDIPMQRGVVLRAMLIDMCYDVPLGELQQLSKAKEAKLRWNDWVIPVDDALKADIAGFLEAAQK